MVGIVIPIQCEGGPGTLGSSSSGSTKRFDAKCTGNRKGSDAVLRKPMLKKKFKAKITDIQHSDPAGG